MTGGAKNFEIPKRMKKAFKEGIIKAAISTDAWIITGGTNYGVMQLVGEAVKEECPLYYSSESKLTLLGICTKEKIAGAEDLTGEKVYALTPVPNKVLLDPNHNNFILVDQKLGAVFGQEIDFRLNLECHLSNQELLSNQEALSGQEALTSQEATNEQVEKVLKLKEKIPLVLIVVNGGTNTLLTVNQAINKNVPILILAVKNFD